MHSGKFEKLSDWLIIIIVILYFLFYASILINARYEMQYNVSEQRSVQWEVVKMLYMYLAERLVWVLVLVMEFLKF